MKISHQPTVQKEFLALSNAGLGKLTTKQESSTI